MGGAGSSRDDEIIRNRGDIGDPDHPDILCLVLVQRRYDAAYDFLGFQIFHSYFLLDCRPSAGRQAAELSSGAFMPDWGTAISDIAWVWVSLAPPAANSVTWRLASVTAIP